MTDPSQSPTVSVVVPVYNGGEDFRKCLASLAAAQPAPVEIVVVADGDTDASWRVAEESGARVLRLPAPRGPARARNLGAREAKGEILFFVDADVTVHSDAVGQAANAFRSDPELAAVFGSYDDEPSEPNFLSQYKNLQHHWVHQTGNEEASTFWTGCGAVRREIFLEMGGFDEGYGRPCIEDIELGYRLRRAGYRIRLVKNLQAKHLKRWGVRSLLAADFLHRALPWTDLILSEGRFVDDLNLKVSSRICVVLAWVLLGSVAGVFAVSGLWPVAVLCAGALVMLNRDFYRFLYRKRGPWFVAKAIPWHWFYYVYSGLAFAVGFVRHHLGLGRPRVGRLAEGSPRGTPDGG